MLKRVCVAAGIGIVAAAAPVARASAEPTVLRFAPGAVTLRTQGRVSPRVYKHLYSLDLRKGQTLTLNFEGGGPLVGVVDCQGDSEGPLSGYGDTYVVPKTGPCILTIEISPMAERWTGGYRLAVTAR